MSNCSFSNFNVVTIDLMLKKYPNIISNLLQIFQIDYCTYDDKIYTPLGILDNEESIDKDSTLCECSKFLFELNVLYYIYDANKCMLTKGQVRNENFSMSTKKIIVSIMNDGDIENVTINQNQSTSVEIQMINLNDPTIQNNMGNFYEDTLLGIVKAFENRGIENTVQFKNEAIKQEFKQEYEYNKIETSANSRLETSVNKIIQSDFKKVVQAMVINNQIIQVQLDNVQWGGKATLDLDQESVVTILIESLSDQMLETFFQNIFDSTSMQSCKIEEEDSNQDVKEETSNPLVFYIVIALIVVVLILTIGIIVYNQRNKNQQQQQSKKKQQQSKKNQRQQQQTQNQ